MTQSDNLCLIGEDALDREKLLAWLESGENRRLFLIGCGEMFSHSRIRAYDASLWIQQNFAANEVGWSAVMQPLEIRAKEGWEGLKRRVEESHLAAHVLFSGVSDLGIKAYVHTRANEKRGPYVLLSSLKNCLKGVPAIIAGAGPSLADALPTIEAAAEKALLIGAGTALSLLGRRGIEPHLGCVLDARTSPEFLKNAKKSLYCVHTQLHPDAMAEIEGRKILVPGQGVFPWEAWWLGDPETFELGFTAADAAMQVAFHLGCNPILCVGTDLCYRGEEKYAEKHDSDKFDLIEVKNRKGKTVLTQRDWLMAAHWQRRFMAEHPERRWISAAEEGLPLGDAIEVASWEEALRCLGLKVDAGARLASRVAAAPEWKLDGGRERRWQESLEGGEEDLVYRLYLAPLWNLWRSVVQRETKSEEEFLERRSRFFQETITALKTASFP